MQKTNSILITTPILSEIGGVSSFWNALFKSFKKNKDINFKVLEIGGHGKNLLGPLLDQWKFYKSSKKDINSAIINPSLLNKSFFRDALFAKRLSMKKIPFVVFFHGWDLNFEEKVTQKYKKFFLNSFGKATKIFVLSEDFKNKIFDWGYKGEVIVQTTTVDADLTKNFSLEDKINKNSKKIKILFLSRLVKEKGIFELLEAFENLSRDKNNLELTVAGNGEIFNQLQEQLKEKKNIRLTGYVEGEAKSTLFQESDIYILPSYSEGLPISVLEAMSFGLPIITTKVGGLKRFFKDGAMGYFIEAKNSTDIEEKIKLILSNKEKSIEISKFNYQYAQDNLTNDVIAQKLANHLKELQ
jgi:glycosyltransferase involved in cell wall biosynthesis